MHSILYALSQFDAEAIVVGPPDMSLLPEFKAELDELNVAYREAGDVRDVIGEADVIYMEPVVQADYTASRVERGGETGLTPPEYVVTRAAAAGEGASGPRSSCTRCRAWTSCPRTSTPRGTSATGSRRSTASCLRMSLLSLVLGAAE